MMKFSKGRSFLLILGVLGVFILLILLILPNLFNQKERQNFSDEIRVEEASKNFQIDQLGDSISLVPGQFYQRSQFHEWLLGKAYRKVWQLEVKVPVLDLEQFQGGLEPLEFSGNQQTIGIEAKDPKDRVWSIRSINKDQSKALPSFLRPTILRPMFRDQASALNPYGALAVPVLAEAAGLHHTNPRLFFFPYNEKYGDYNHRMAGRLVLIEEEADETWANSPNFRHPQEIMDTEDMMEMAKSKKIPVDTLLYARSRLFDILISDWDRHEGNWEWALVQNDHRQEFEPVPVDRDMAFYNFSNGILNQVVLLFNEKFQSFSPDFKNIEGLMYQSKTLDQSILSKIEMEDLIREAEVLQKQLTEETINKAFRKYPPEVYNAIGKEHEEILKERLNKLPEVAKKLYTLIRENKQ